MNEISQFRELLLLHVVFRMWCDHSYLSHQTTFDFICFSLFTDPPHKLRAKAYEKSFSIDARAAAATFWDCKHVASAT